jgi:N-acyl-D-aspartate/D-glutamate deacylase
MLRPLKWQSLLALLGGIVISPPILRAQQPQTSDYDVVIRGGRVFDGAGNPWILADVGIKDGRFAAIGQVTGRGKTEIDARGKYVSPGWIDMMDHSILVVGRNPLAENKLMMGVTTAISGEGGPPVRADSLASFFTRLDAQGISINLGTYYNAGQARTEVLGPVARTPNADELTRMRSIIEAAMRAGALGLSSALIYPPRERLGLGAGDCGRSLRWAVRKSHSR